MDIVKDKQEITIGIYKCMIYQSGSAWWCNNKSGDMNSDLFKQFGITLSELEKFLGYKTSGSFPQCRSAEELTKVIEFIISKDPANKPKEEEDYVGRTIKALVQSPQNTGVQIGEEIKILKQSTSNYVLDRNSKGTPGMWINRPLDLKHWELLPEESVKKVEEYPVIDMKAIQEECKRRFPIGCTYQDSSDKSARVLKQDYSTYNIYGEKHVYAHEGGGCLYKDGKYATLVSLPEEKTIKSESSEYTKGKWYTSPKWYGTSYLKLYYIKDDQAFFTEKIDNDGHQCKKDWWSMVGYKLLEADMDKVSEHLPDGHPDKVFKSRFKVGDWIMWDGRTKNGPYKLTAVDGKGFLDHFGLHRATEDKDYRLATAEELSKEIPSIPEYVECIDSSLSQAKKGKIYPVISNQKCRCENNKEYFWNTREFKPSNKEAYDLQSKLFMPEYVECISKDFYAIKLGVIYKLEPTSTINSYYLKDVNVGSYSSHHFKPSTKEAYDAQFVTTSSTLPKKWCLKITSSNKEVLNKWRKRQPNFNASTTVGFTGWLLSDAYDGTYTHWDVNVPNGYTEITLQQFYDNVYHIDVYDIIKKESSVYEYDPYETIKTKPLIEDVQSVSVKLSTRKNNNKFKF